MFGDLEIYRLYTEILKKMLYHELNLIYETYLLY